MGPNTVEEGAFVDGRRVPGRRLAGDDTIEADCLYVKWPRKGEAPAPQPRMSTEGIQRFPRRCGQNASLPAEAIAHRAFPSNPPHSQCISAARNHLCTWRHRGHKRHANDEP